MPRKKKKSGCGCLTFIFLMVVVGIGFNWFKPQQYLNISQFLPKNKQPPTETIPIFTPPPSPSPTNTPSISSFPFPQNVPQGTTINLEGSNSMAQINQGIKNSFQQQFLGTNINLSANGSNQGIQDLLTEKIDIAAVARPLTDLEKREGLVAIPITQDAIAIIVNNNNPYRRGLTSQEVQGIFTGAITNWSMLGGEAQPIKVINRPPISGSRQVFQKDVLNNNYFGITPNFVTVEQDSISAILPQLNDDGISYASYAQVRDQMSVRVIPIDGLIPESDLYPYRRALFYVYKTPASPAVQAFLGYVTSPQGKQIIETAQFDVNMSQVAQTLPSPQPKVTQTPSPQPQISPDNKPITKQPLKAIRGIYLSRYQVTNNASEQTIRERVRYYKSQGINTIIHGVWGNGCTMYNSEVMQQTLGFKSCPNLFREQWLEWLIDEAHQQGMEVHAYFEKGIKIDKNSPIFKKAVAHKWLVAGVDKTYSGIDHYVLDVEVPEVANFFKDIMVEFVKKYPNIDAVQWDDYLGYHAELPGQVDRTANLTKFIQQMIKEAKQVNPSVSFDLCHHNPYWAKRYFAADWENWDVDRVFIQAYNEKNFKEELNYAQSYAGIAITDQQFHRLPELLSNPKVSNILIFPLDGKPEKTASNLKALWQSN